MVVREVVEGNAGVRGWRTWMRPVALTALVPMALLLGAGDALANVSGSFVVFDPTYGGATCNTPSTTQTFCFKAELHAVDGQDVNGVAFQVPAGWSLLGASTVGPKTCDNGGTFNFLTSVTLDADEVWLYELLRPGAPDTCVTYYCLDVTSDATATDRSVSWHWAGGGASWASPQRPCSNDGYNATGMLACDESVFPVATVPVCATPVELQSLSVH